MCPLQSHPLKAAVIDDVHTASAHGFRALVRTIWTIDYSRLNQAAHLVVRACTTRADHCVCIPVGLNSIARRSTLHAVNLIALSNCTVRDRLVSSIRYVATIYMYVRRSAEIRMRLGWVQQGLTSQQTHYRSFRGRVLCVKRPNQQCHSTEGREVLRTRLKFH